MDQKPKSDLSSMQGQPKTNKTEQEEFQKRTEQRLQKLEAFIRQRFGVTFDEFCKREDKREQEQAKHTPAEKEITIVYDSGLKQCKDQNAGSCAQPQALHEVKKQVSIKDDLVPEVKIPCDDVSSQPTDCDNDIKVKKQAQAPSLYGSDIINIYPELNHWVEARGHLVRCKECHITEKSYWATFNHIVKDHPMLANQTSMKGSPYCDYIFGKRTMWRLRCPYCVEIINGNQRREHCLNICKKIPMNIKEGINSTKRFLFSSYYVTPQIGVDTWDDEQDTEKANLPNKNEKELNEQNQKSHPTPKPAPLATTVPSPKKNSAPVGILHPPMMIKNPSITIPLIGTAIVCESETEQQTKSVVKLIPTKKVTFALNIKDEKSTTKKRPPPPLLKRKWESTSHDEVRSHEDTSEPIRLCRFADCQAVFFKLDDLINHFFQDHQGGGHTCNRCEKVFRKEVNRDTHRCIGFVAGHKKE